MHISPLTLSKGHPRFPIIATSGIDNDIKIWSPTKEDGVSIEKCSRFFVSFQLP